MAKGSVKGTKETVPKLGRPHPPSFYKELAERQEISSEGPSPKIATVSGADVLSTLKGLGRGYDDELSQLLEIPKTLQSFDNPAGGFRFYFRGDARGLGNLFEGVGGGKLYAPKTDYGIIIRESMDRTEFVFYDSMRRIAVHGILMDFHEMPVQKDWSAVKDAIKSAHALAGSERARAERLFALSIAGRVLLVRPEEPPAPGPSIPPSTR